MRKVKVCGHGFRWPDALDHADSGPSLQTLGRPPSLKLLGFKPLKGYLRFEETIKHSYFIYPDEEVRQRPVLAPGLPGL